MFKSNSDIYKFLNKCQEAYHRGEPLISDDVFDKLADLSGFNELGTKEITNKIKHIQKMFSLKKVYDDEKYNVEFASGYVKTPKLDGSAIELVYINGGLVSASTRGDGVYGEDILDKAFAIDNIPPIFYTDKELVQITGEVVCDKSIDNARNYAAGALNLKDLEEFKKRKVFFVAYGIFPAEETYIDDLAKLKFYGFDTVLDSDWSNVRQDGVVYRCKSNKEYYSLGFTSKHPRGAYALKKRADVEIKETKLLDVVWQVGKSGKVTPVAIFEDINIDDANINRATLHNAGFIEDMDLHIGDTILITRSGGIIPKVVGKL